MGVEKVRKTHSFESIFQYLILVNNLQQIIYNFQDGRCVPGAGAVEMELSKQVNDFGKTCEGLEQYSVQRFAKALQVIPIKNINHFNTEWIHFWL